MMMPVRQAHATVVSVVRGLHVRDRHVQVQAQVVLPVRPHQPVQVPAQADVLAKAVPAVPVRVRQVRSAVQAAQDQTVARAATQAIRPATPTAPVVPPIFPANFYRSLLLTQAGSSSL